MKNAIVCFIFFIGLLVMGFTSAPDSVKDTSQQSDLVKVAGTDVIIVAAPVLPVPEDPASGILDFLRFNGAEILLGAFAFLKIVVNLTPTKKDDDIFGMLDKFINFFVPNNRVGGGTFPKYGM
jgi:hypothetical protein